MEIAKINIIGTSVVVSDLKTVTSGMVGATVGITYDDTWDGLNKQVVFKTAFKTVNADGTAVPPELLRISGINLLAGVYGYTGDGSVAIPTVWASLGSIQSGADTEGDEAAKPTNPIWMDAVNTAKNADGKAEAALESAASAERKAESAFDMASAASERAGAASVQASAATEQANAAATAASAASKKAAEAAEQAGAASERTEALVPRVEALETNISQADWNVNDETDPAYIKNRPFYAGDPVLTELLPETTLQFTDGAAELLDAPGVLLETLSKNDQTYIVNWDGTEYEVTASPFMGAIPYIGNLALVEGEQENTGEPFLILYEDIITVYTNDPGAEHAISVTHAERAIRKLPSKFLADDVGNKLPFFDLKEMGMTDVTSMNALKTLAVDTTQLRIAMGNGQIKIAFGVDGAVIKTVLSCGIIFGNSIYASALILNTQKIGGLELSPVIVALIAVEGGIYFLLKEIGTESTSTTQE